METKVLQNLMPAPWFQAKASGGSLYSIVRGELDRKPSPGERALGPFILPSFQRGSVWTREQQIRLLESIWDGLPIGAYVVNEVQEMNHPCDGWLLDGQQRITAILAYAAGDFPVYGHRFPDLPAHEQRAFLARPVAVLTSRIEDEDACREVYRRLAYGGTAHAPVQA